MTLQILNNTRELAQQLRVDSVLCTTAAGSGHPTSSMSAAELMAALLAGTCATTGSGQPTRPTTT